MKRSFFGQLIQRWKAETPSFFKRISNTGLWLMGVGTGLVGLNEIPNIHLPAFLSTISTHMITWGTIMAAVAKLVVKPAYVEAVQEKGPMVPTVQEIKEVKEAISADNEIKGN